MKGIVATMSISYIFVMMAVIFFATLDSNGQNILPLVSAVAIHNLTSSTNATSNVSSTTTAGSSHIYRGGQGAGAGGE